MLWILHETRTFCEGYYGLSETRLARILDLMRVLNSLRAVLNLISEVNDFFDLQILWSLSLSLHLA